MRKEERGEPQESGDKHAITRNSEIPDLARPLYRPNTSAPVLHSAASLR